MAVTATPAAAATGAACAGSTRPPTPATPSLAPTSTDAPKPLFARPFPNEILLAIFGFLGAADLCAASATCHGWRRLAGEFEMTLWSALCERDLMLPVRAPEARIHRLNQRPQRHMAMPMPGGPTASEGTPAEASVPPLSRRAAYAVRHDMLRGRHAFRRFYFFDRTAAADSLRLSPRLDTGSGLDAPAIRGPPVFRGYRTAAAREPIGPLGPVQSAEAVHSEIPGLTGAECATVWCERKRARSGFEVADEDDKGGGRKRQREKEEWRRVSSRYTLAWAADAFEPYSVCLDAGSGLVCYVNRDDPLEVRMMALDTFGGAGGDFAAAAAAGPVEVLSTRTQHEYPIRLLLSNGRGTLVTFDESSKTVVWDVRRRRLRCVLIDPPRALDELLREFVFSVNINGVLIVTGSVDGRVCVWHAGEGDEERCAACHGGGGVGDGGGAAATGSSSNDARSGGVTAVEEGSADTAPACACRAGTLLLELCIPERYAGTVTDSSLINVAVWGSRVAYAMYDGHIYVYALSLEDYPNDADDEAEPGGEDGDASASPRPPPAVEYVGSGSDAVAAVVRGSRLPFCACDIDGEFCHTQPCTRPRRYVARLEQHLSVFGAEAARRDGTAAATTVTGAAGSEGGAVNPPGDGGGGAGNGEAQVGGGSNQPMTLAMHGGVLLTNGARKSELFLWDLSAGQLACVLSERGNHASMTALQQRRRRRLSSSRRRRRRVLRTGAEEDGDDEIAGEEGGGEGTDGGSDVEAAATATMEALTSAASRSIQFAELSRCGTMVIGTVGEPDLAAAAGLRLDRMLLGDGDEDDGDDGEDEDDGARGGGDGGGDIGGGDDGGVARQGHEPGEGLGGGMEDGVGGVAAGPADGDGAALRVIPARGMSLGVVDEGGVGTLVAEVRAAAAAEATRAAGGDVVAAALAAVRRAGAAFAAAVTRRVVDAGDGDVGGAAGGAMGPEAEAAREVVEDDEVQVGSVHNGDDDDDNDDDEDGDGRRMAPRLGLWEFGDMRPEAISDCGNFSTRSGSGGAPVRVDASATGAVGAGVVVRRRVERRVLPPGVEAWLVAEEVYVAAEEG
ncbi:hypothetical protein HK405_003927 [Cladochytrium tenue]|nr:hypothetical protein HK405_003927 [Cladochytrium tenue]